MNFGNLLLDRELGQPAQRIERAIARFNNALTVYTPQSYPERRARVMLNLGNAYSERLTGDRSDNVERAIAAYQHALRFYTRESDPTKWAITQNNLGGALRNRLQGERARNLADAAAAHEAALGVHTPTAFPWMHMRSAQLAGDVAAARGDWSAARAYYRKAIETSHRLFAGGLNRAEAEGVAREGGGLFAAAAYAALMQNRPMGALDILESGKTRLLRVALGLDALDLAPELRHDLDRTRIELRDLEGRLDLVEGDERLQTIAQLETRRAEAQRIVDGAADTGRAGGSTESALATAERLLSHYQAIVLPIVTEQGASVLVLVRGKGAPSVTPVAIKGLDARTLNRFVHGEESSGRVGGWLGAYEINYLPVAEQQTRLPQWLQTIGELPPRLWNLIGAAMADALQAGGVGPNSAVLWVPQGSLGLLPITIAAGGTAGSALIDRYTFSVAPSLAAAETALRRARQFAAEPTLTAVINPTGDLRFTEPEGLFAASHFQQGRRRLLSADARSEAVLASLSKSSHWHFATHGTFSWSNPGQSGLRLAGDDRLTIRQLLDRVDPGHPRLVALSACETGLFDFQSAPDEFIGLPVAFLQAGAAGVVGTLWPVDDTSTALIMMKFYDLHMAKKTAPALALRQAQLWLRDATRQDVSSFLDDMLRSGRLSSAYADLLRASLTGGAAADRPFSHPFYWAAFQFYGS